jgi:hypothetical protein
VELLEPVSMALSSEVCELPRGQKERLRPMYNQVDSGCTSRVDTPEQSSSFLQHPLAFEHRLPGVASLSPSQPAAHHPHCMGPEENQDA